MAQFNRAGHGMLGQENPLQQVRTGIQRVAKTLLRPLIFRYPPIGLQPERLQLWLNTLIGTMDVPGAVAEVGCSVGGTAAYSWRLLQNFGAEARGYICIDTFGGFVDSHFSDDVNRGNTAANRWIFSANSIRLTRKILNQHGAQSVELIQGDIATISDHLLPEKISAALLDVDLAVPIYEGLKKLYPRLSSGGSILIDDCPENYDWQARKGYEQFCREFAIPARYLHGMGIIHRE